MGEDGIELEKYEEKAVCIYCEGENIVIYWEPRYNGFRGTCDECSTNWAES